MTHNKLMAEILKLDQKSDYYLYPAGVEGYYHLGQTGEFGLLLIDASPDKVLAFVKRNAQVL